MERATSIEELLRNSLAIEQNCLASYDPENPEEKSMWVFHLGAESAYRWLLGWLKEEKEKEK